MKKMDKKIPKFKNEDEEREFWATHSPLDYFDPSNFKRASFPKLKPSLKSISIRLPEDMLAELKILARHRLTKQRQQQADADLLAGLERIGIDEISHRKGQRYLTVVVDHDSGRLVWAAPGRDKATVEAFFDALGKKRTKQLKLVSCDMAGWIEAVLGKRCPKAKRCVDPFHVIALATEALDQIRREVWNEARRQGQGEVAAELKGARYALWKNPENLTERQQSKLADVERLNRPLYRAYLLKEQLRQIYRLGPKAAIRLLDEWLQWARRCRLRPFVKLARTIAEQREGIVAAIRHGLSNARVEAINTQIRLIARRAFGFHSPEALISLAMLKLGGLCPPLPGRVTLT